MIANTDASKSGCSVTLVAWVAVSMRGKTRDGEGIKASQPCVICFSKREKVAVDSSSERSPFTRSLGVRHPLRS